MAVFFFRTFPTTDHTQLLLFEKKSKIIHIYFYASYSPRFPTPSLDSRRNDPQVNKDSQNGCKKMISYEMFKTRAKILSDKLHLQSWCHKELFKQLNWTMIIVSQWLPEKNFQNHRLITRRPTSNVLEIRKFRIILFSEYRKSYGKA